MLFRAAINSKWLYYCICGIIVLMKNFSTFTKDELKKLNKTSLILIIGSLQNQIEHISGQLDTLTEQIALMNQRSFGRKTDRFDQFPGQMSLFGGTDSSTLPAAEPEITEITVSAHTRKTKSRREDLLEGLPARIHNHTLSDEELAEQFPEGYKELPVEIYKRLSVIPETYMVDEHHVHVYASKKNDGRIVRAARPKDMFRNSIATPSLVSDVITSKFLNHVPTDRQSKRFMENGIPLETNTLSNWLIRSSEVYLGTIYDELIRAILGSKVIHADETPFNVIRDGRDPGANSYMWVYRSGVCDIHPVVIYDYQESRRMDHPEEFLKDYNGILVTDGYQVYHSLVKKRTGLLVAGCWVHAKRKFSELIKFLGKNAADGIIAAEASKRISRLFHLDKQWKDLSKEEREKQRQLVLKPLVDDFFAWAKESILKVPAESATGRGLQYCINQEQFLRVFLSNGDVPMDNNLAEQAIRPFTIGRKNWVTTNSIEGARSNAILYSLVETARANDLHVYNYINYILEELVKHLDDTDRSFIKDLLPWSDKVRQKCPVLKKS